MARVDIVFGSIDQGDPRTYVEQKIRSMFRAVELQTGSSPRSRPSAKTIDAYVDGIMRSRRGGRTPSISVARRHDLRSLTPAQRRLVKRRIDCLTTLVDHQFPLLDGEHVDADSDLPTYLSAAWHDYPLGTIVLRRRTNLATTYYVVPDAFADLRNGRVVLRDAPPLRAASPLAAAALPDFASIARDIAKALAGQAPSPFKKIGAFLIDQFWPSGSKASQDWETVYARLQEIVRNGLAAKEVETAATKVKGFVSFLSNEYVELKKSPRRRPDDLLHALQPYDTAFFMDIVNVFMFASKPTADIAAASLANFLLGANLHIALNQERALVDPVYADDPSQSPYAKTAANLAKDYADYATAAWEGVITERLKQVTDVKVDHETHCSGGPAARCITFYFYWFEDNNPKPKYKSEVYSYNDQDKHPPDARKQATEARDAYLAKLRADLKKQMPELVGYWNQIHDNSIALTYGAPEAAPALKADAWAGSLPVRGTRKWKDGYKVRYAVSYFHNRTETAKGPWWSPKGADKDGYLAGAPNAFPTLEALPIDPFYHAEGRYLYRQFDGFKEERVATIRDNSSVEFCDKKK